MARRAAPRLPTAARPGILPFSRRAAARSSTHFQRRRRARRGVPPQGLRQPRVLRRAVLGEYIDLIMQTRQRGCIINSLLGPAEPAATRSCVWLLKRGGKFYIG